MMIMMFLMMKMMKMQLGFIYYVAHDERMYRKIVGLDDGY
jgi:hypothetical protein